MEIGGLDGILFSNTYLYRFAFYWSGVLVKLTPKYYAKLVTNRPDEIATVNAGVCGEQRTLHYVNQYGAVGRFEFASKSFRKQWWGDLMTKDTTELECSSLADILTNHAAAPSVSHYDFYSDSPSGCL